jgi:outer membrane receptor for ferrienterochelin and colicin
VRVRTMPKPSVLQIAVAGLLLSGASVADPVPKTLTADGELETVTVYARRITPVTHVAATVSVVDKDRIEATLASDIREIVRYEPGLSVRNDPFRFGLDTISIRGLGGNRVAVEIDGVPAASRSAPIPTPVVPSSTPRSSTGSSFSKAQPRRCTAATRSAESFRTGPSRLRRCCTAAWTSSR